jgi:hypothetical protein
MRAQRVFEVFVAIALSTGTSDRAWSQNGSGSEKVGCIVKLAGIQSNCPTGWRIVDEADRGTTIGDFERPDRATNLTIPAGRATIAFHPMPAIYKSFKEWVYAATRNAPDAIQTSKNLTSKSVGAISAFCFTSPDSQRGWIYESYFFEINGIPVNLELNYERTSQKAQEYRALLNKLVENLELPGH